MASNPWTDAENAVDEVAHDVSEALDTLKVSLDEFLGAACREEIQRCVRWVRTGLPAAEVIAGMESFEEPGEAASRKEGE